MFARRKWSRAGVNVLEFMKMEGGEDKIRLRLAWFWRYCVAEKKLHSGVDSYAVFCPTIRSPQNIDYQPPGDINRSFFLLTFSSSCDFFKIVTQRLRLNPES